ncbi:MAG: hypothetical protein AB7I41_08785 [Candidatus Sericytochromatia bacterium]
MPAETSPLSLISALEDLSKALLLRLNPALPGQEPALDVEALLALLEQRDQLLEKVASLRPLIQVDPTLLARLEALAQQDVVLISQAQLALQGIQTELQGLGRNLNATTSYLEQGNFEETSYYFENQG